MQLKMTGLLLAVFALFAVIVFVSVKVLDPGVRQPFVGYLSVASLISMFASPLFIIVSTRQDVHTHFHFRRCGSFSTNMLFTCNVFPPEIGDQNKKC